MEVSNEPVSGPPTPPPPPSPFGPPTPWSWRLLIALVVVGLAAVAYRSRNTLDPRVLAGMGIVCFFGIAAFFSSSLQSVNWRTIVVGFILQIALVLFIDKFEIPWGESSVKPGRAFFKGVGDAVKQLLEFTNAGSRFVFGLLAEPETINQVFPYKGFIFAFSALPTIIFIASFFSVLYYFGVLQFIVRLMAVFMMRLMGTSGAESLSVTANIFMGQTEAPLIIKPYVPRMTQSELLTMMVGGMAHISGGVMAVYIGMGANPEAILATSVMAAPGSLYLSKLLLPELDEPETRGKVKTVVEQHHVNVIDAASAGAGDGMRLALNVGAMLIAFLAFIAMINHLLGYVRSGHSLLESIVQAPTTELQVGGVLAHVSVFLILLALLDPLFRKYAGWSVWRGLWSPGGSDFGRSLGLVVGAMLLFVLATELALRNLPEQLSLQGIFSRVFAPIAVLMGVQGDAQIAAMADLLGTKLVANEFVAYVDLVNKHKEDLPRDSRAFILATYALTGFANFSSIGIQIGGIGAMAPSRRSDLARLGMRALLTGFLVTLINASIAGMLLTFTDSPKP